jgi:hypothetical protein
MGLGKTIKKAYMKGKKKAYGSKGVKGRYIRPGFTKGMSNLIKDVEMIKGRLNVEKKHKETDVSTFTLGQVNGNVEGSEVKDITPLITGGIDSDERIGRSLKLTGLSFPISFTQQAKCLGDRKVRITLLRVRSADGGVSGQEARDTVWDANPLTTMRDYDCPRSYRNSKNDGITIVRSMTCYVKGPQLNDATSAGAAIADYERQIKNVRFSVKLEDVLRYGNETDTIPEGIKYYLVFQCNAGNQAGTTTSTKDVAVKTVDSGLEVRLAQRSWWVDN